jgi:hypothetical protein
MTGYYNYVTYVGKDFKIDVTIVIIRRVMLASSRVLQQPSRAH